MVQTSKQTVLINLFAQPGAGKSVLMMDLAARMKKENISVEMSPEYVKKMAYEGKAPDSIDQMYIFGKEAQHQKALMGKVDYIISDAPVLLVAWYYYKVSGSQSLFPVAKEFEEIAKEKHNTQFVNFFLPRKTLYDPNGRFQTEQESDIIAAEIKKMLKERKIEYNFLDCPADNRVAEIMKILLNQR